MRYLPLLVLGSNLEVERSEYRYSCLVFVGPLQPPLSLVLEQRQQDSLTFPCPFLFLPLFFPSFFPFSLKRAPQLV